MKYEPYLSRDNQRKTCFPLMLEEMWEQPDSGQCLWLIYPSSSEISISLLCDSPKPLRRYSDVCPLMKHREADLWQAAVDEERENTTVLLASANLTRKRKKLWTTDHIRTPYSPLYIRWWTQLSTRSITDTSSTFTR